MGGGGGLVRKLTINDSCYKGKVCSHRSLIIGYITKMTPEKANMIQLEEVCRGWGGGGGGGHEANLLGW